MIRELIEAFAFEIRMLKSVQRRRVTVPADCPLTDCQTCRTDPQPPDVVAEEQRAGETSHAIWWLISAYPDVWYFARPDTVQNVAARLVRLRAAIKDGRIAR